MYFLKVEKPFLQMCVLKVLVFIAPPRDMYVGMDTNYSASYSPCLSFLVLLLSISSKTICSKLSDQVYIDMDVGLKFMCAGSCANPPKVFVPSFAPFLNPTLKI